MPTLSKKIARQQALGNRAKVKDLAQLKKPKVTGGLAPKPPESTQTQYPVTQQTDSTTEASTSAPPANPTYSPSTPQSGIGHSSYNPASGQPDPRDSEYWANYAKLMATSQQSLAAQQLEQSQSDTAFALEKINRGEQRRRSVRDMAESLIGTGLLRSGAHNRRQTEATTDFLTEMGGLERGKGDEDAARKAQMDAILANFGIDEQALYTGAGGRYADKQAKAAADAQALAEVAGAGEAEAQKKKKKKGGRTLSQTQTLRRPGFKAKVKK